jgi:TonB family protein
MTTLLQTTLIWLTLYLTYRFGIARERRFGLNRAALLLSLGAGLLAPWLSWDWATATPPAAVSEAVLWLDTVYLDSVGAPIDRSLNTWQWLFLAGAMLGLIRLLYGGYQIYGLCRMGRRVRIDGVPVIWLPQPTEPFAWGPYLFWSDVPGLDATERAVILAHERAHVRLGHTVDLLLFDLLLVPLWWHPLLYLYRAELRRVHEYQADAFALRRGHNPQEYARLLLRRALTGSRPIAGATPVLSHAFHTSQLKKRIEMIRTTSTPTQLWKYALLLPVALLAFYACGAVEEEAAVPAETAAMATMTSDKPTPDGEKVYTTVEQMPVFGNCEGFSGPELMRCSNTNLMTHIFENLQYPAAAKEAGIQGRAVVSFVVGSDGAVADAEIKISSLPDGKVTDDAETAAYTAMDAAVLAAVNELPAFTSPGVQAGKTVNTQLMLPVQFKLD